MLEPETRISDDCPILFAIKGACHEIALRFLCPVYLVGSFVTDPKNAGDIDIIIVMSEDRHKRLFGETKFNDKRLKFRRKQKMYLEDHLRTYDFDFKVQTPEKFSIFPEHKRMRVDSIDDNILLPTFDELFSLNEKD